MKSPEENQLTTGQSLPEPVCYLIERCLRSCPGRWESAGSFVAGSQWRDERLVNDETMREEARGYAKAWPAYLARARHPNGEILSDNAQDQP